MNIRHTISLLETTLFEYNIGALDQSIGARLLDKWTKEGKPYSSNILASKKENNNSVDDLETLRKNLDDITSQDLIKFIEPYDPTPNKKYMTWLVSRYAGKRGGINRFEDIPARAERALDTYMRLSRKHLLKPEHKDINQIKALNELEKILDEYKEEETQSGAEETAGIEKKMFAEGDAELVYNDATWKIVIPKTHEASCYFGKNTRWCTTSEDSPHYHEQYSKDGPLYVILHKPQNERWQWHFESRQYMDEEDSQINIDEFVNDEDFKVPVAKIIEHKGGMGKAAIADAQWMKYIDFKEMESDEAGETVRDIMDGNGVKYEGYDAERNEIIMDAWKDITTLVEYNGDKTAKWIMGFINGDDFLDSWREYEKSDIDDFISGLPTHIEEEVEKYIQKAYPEDAKDEDMTLFEVLDENDDDMIDQARNAMNDGARVGTEADMLKSLQSSIEGFEPESGGSIVMKNGMWNQIEYRLSISEVAENLVDEYGEIVELTDDLEFKVDEPHYGFDGYEESAAHEYFFDNATFEYVDPDQTDMFRQMKP